MSDLLAQELEKYLIPVEDWPTCPHKQAVELAEKESAQGVPTGVACKDDKWYVIQTSGQGSYVIWSEEYPSILFKRLFDKPLTSYQRLQVKIEGIFDEVSYSRDWYEG